MQEILEGSDPPQLGYGPLQPKGIKTIALGREGEINIIIYILLYSYYNYVILNVW